MPAAASRHSDVAVRSSVGVGAEPRAENQDNFLLIDAAGVATFLCDEQLHRQHIAGWPAGQVRAAVLDGMGGHGHGREAAEAAVAGLLAIPACATLDELSQRLDVLHLSLQDEFAQAGDARRRPGTTLTLLEIPPGGRALLYHVGDSRLYEIGADAIAPLTVDHVPATAFAMNGVLDEDEWWQQVHGEHRSQISQAFILGNAFANPALLSDPLFPLTPHNLPHWLVPLHDRRALALRPDRMYLLATDGFWSCDQADGWIARWPALLRGSHNASAALGRLFEAIERRPPPGLHADNLTALVLCPVALARSADETALPEAGDGE